MSKNNSTPPATPAVDKAARDNRANQLNPNNAVYHSSRGGTPPASKPGSTGRGR